MQKSRRVLKHLRYDVQSAVETKHHLIVAHEVTNHGYDRDALAMMASAAKDAMPGGSRGHSRHEITDVSQALCSLTSTDHVELGATGVPFIAAGDQAVAVDARQRLISIEYERLI